MTEQIYTDKEILADALTAEKAATNNYNAFATAIVVSILVIKNKVENAKQKFSQCVKTV